MKNRIKACRVTAGLKKGEAERLLGVSAKSLYNYEHGADIPASVLIKMAEIYDCTTDYLLGISNHTTITVINKNDSEAIAVISKSKVAVHKDFNVILSPG